MARAPIRAAGGIVVREGPAPLIAVVQLRKRSDWVLPKGKLHGKESALAAARREVLEETGHKVTVHEFLGTMTYDVRGRPKVVEFWRMSALGRPARKLTRDVKAVEWLPLEQALEKLTHSRERVFLANVGPVALEAAAAPARKTAAAERPGGERRIASPKQPAQADVDAAAIPSARDNVVELAERSGPRRLVDKALAWLRQKMPGNRAQPG
jgi:8-oxo-dGTP diphosphatase